MELQQETTVRNMKTFKLIQASKYFHNFFKFQTFVIMI